MRALRCNLPPYIARAARPIQTRSRSWPVTVTKPKFRYRSSPGARVTLDDHDLEFAPGGGQGAGQPEDPGAHDRQIKLFRSCARRFHDPLDCNFAVLVFGVMKKINEPARSIDVVLETDVLVVGSGPGGLAAALAAARAGARTALLDRNGCFGGNITQVGVEGFAWYRHEKTVDCEGIGIEFEQRAKAMGAAMPEPQSLSHALDAEMFKWVADTLVQEAGVTPLLHRLGVGAHPGKRRHYRCHYREQGRPRGHPCQARD